MRTHRWLETLHTLNPASTILSAIFVAFFLSVLSFCVFVPIFRFFIPECAPGQIDGQCRLGTFAALVLALFGAFAVWVGVAIAISIRLFRRRKRMAVESGIKSLKLIND